MSESLLSLAPHRIIEDALKGGSGRGPATLFDRGSCESALFFGASFDPEYHQEDLGSDAIEKVRPDGGYIHAHNLPAEEDDDAPYYFLEDLFGGEGGFLEEKRPVVRFFSIDGLDGDLFCHRNMFPREICPSSMFYVNVFLTPREDFLADLRTWLEDYYDESDDAQPYLGSGHRESFRKVPRRQGRLSLRRKKGA